MSDTQHNGSADLSALPATERAARYRELADMHLRLGGAALVEEARAAHLELAALWTRLASQAELPERRAHGPSAHAGRLSDADSPSL